MWCVTLTAALYALFTWSALAECSVFLQPAEARQLLQASSRRRRANSNLLEEVLPGNLERECYEEQCSQEEAAEIFQTREKTLEFWYRYINLNPCRINPCLNGGICRIDRGGFICLCPPQFQGRTCHEEVLQCHYRNGGCMQYCRDLQGGAGVQCGCADGFTLEPDGYSCSRTIPFPCGRQQTALFGRRSLQFRAESNITVETTTAAMLDELDALNSTEAPPLVMLSNTSSVNETEQTGEEWGEEGEMEDTLRIVGGDLERAGGSPWQVLLHRADGYGFCGGTLVSDRWVLSAAHCLEQKVDHVTIGDLDKYRPDSGEQKIQVQQVFVHPHFHAFTFDSDIALLFLAHPVIRSPTAIPACFPDPHLSHYLLQDGNHGVVTGWGLTRHMGRSSRFLRKVTLPVVSHKDCSLSTEQVITDNMFCAGFLEVPRDACGGDSGGPFVVNYRGTWFLTGIVSWGESCAARGKYGVYTRLGNFLGWIRTTMNRADLNQTEATP